MKAVGAKFNVSEMIYFGPRFDLMESRRLSLKNSQNVSGFVKIKSKLRPK